MTLDVEHGPPTFVLRLTETDLWALEDVLDYYIKHAGGFNRFALELDMAVSRGLESLK